MVLIGQQTRETGNVTIGPVDDGLPKVVCWISYLWPLWDLGVTPSDFQSHSLCFDCRIFGFYRLIHGKIYSFDPLKLHVTHNDSHLHVDDPWHDLRCATDSNGMKSDFARWSLFDGWDRLRQRSGLCHSAKRFSVPKRCWDPAEQAV